MLVLAVPLSSEAGAAGHGSTAVDRSARRPEAAKTHRSHSEAMTIVPSGTAPPGGTVFGTTPADTPESVSFILKPAICLQLKADVEQGVHNFLSVSQFAQTYGQSPGHIYGLEAYLAGFGIQTQADADGLDVTATGTAGQFDQALAVQQLEYHVPAHPGTDGAPQVSRPRRCTGHRRPLNSRPSWPGRYSPCSGSPTTGPSPARRCTPTWPSLRTDRSAPNQCVQLTGLPDDCNLPEDFDADYGLDPLVDGGSIGAGQTIGIVTEAALDPGAPQYFWSNVLGLPSSGRTVTVENVDGGPGAPERLQRLERDGPRCRAVGGSGPRGQRDRLPESELGQWLRRRLLRGRQPERGRERVGQLGHRPKPPSRLGAALGLEPSTYAAAFDEAFLEMAEQGQSAFAAAGDGGAYGGQPA